LQYKVICIPSIFDLYQMESMRGQGRSRKPPVASFKDGLNLFGLYASLADIQDSSRDSSNHVLQETVATNPKDPGCI